MTGRTRKGKRRRESNVVLTLDFDAETTSPQIEVGSEGAGVQTEVGSAPDNSKVGDSDSDGSEGDLARYDDDEVEISEGDDDYLNLFTEAERSFSISIAHYYESTFGAPERSEWLGPEGIIMHICDTFKLAKHKSRKVRRILTRYCDKK